ncbi:MAG: hypothetical protein ACJ74H_03415 [Thermoanaerobaculia bacterium]
MRSITFTFAESATKDQQHDALETLRHLPGVANAAHLKPGAKHPLSARLAYAVLDDDGAAERVLKTLKDLPCVADASEPAQRYMA